MTRLLFVTAFKARHLSKDWEMVCRLGKATINSALQQKDVEVEHQIICHETPNNLPRDPRVKVTTVDFPAPESLENLTEKEGMEDKWKKVQIGLYQGRDFAPDFVMLLDCDDLVSSRIGTTLSNNSKSNGYQIKTGYRWRYGANRLRTDHKFSCGSNVVLSAKLAGMPNGLSSKDREASLILSQGHTIIGEKLTEMGTPLETLPYPGAVNVRDTGENVSHERSPYSIRRVISEIRAWKVWKPLTSKVRDEFALHYD